MLNIDDFVKRLEIILEYYSLNASSFADKIGVQRSSMSHLLSGRNKPSLDFVMKILEIFPDIDLYWLLKGIGNFPKSFEDQTSKLEYNSPPLSNENSIKEDLFSFEEKNENRDRSTINSEIKNFSFLSEEQEIEKIVFFYKNGTFKSYNP